MKISIESEINKKILSSQFQDISDSSSSDDAQNKTAEKRRSAHVSVGLDVRPKTQLKPFTVKEISTPTPPEPVTEKPKPSTLPSFSDDAQNKTAEKTRSAHVSVGLKTQLQPFTVKEISTPTPSEPVTEKPPRLMMAHRTSSPSDREMTSFSKTWALCRSTLSDNVGTTESDVQPPQHSDYITIPGHSRGDTHIPVANCQRESSTKTAKLLDYSDTMVSKDGLIKATSTALKSNKPGYTLCYKLLTELFSIETLVASRRRGIGNTKDKDKPVLDKEKTQAPKNFVVLWCKKHGLMVPREQLLSGAITERISYARKQCSKAPKKD